MPKNQTDGNDELIPLAILEYWVRGDFDELSVEEDLTVRAKYEAIVHEHGINIVNFSESPEFLDAIRKAFFAFIARMK